eukprot:s1318_g17.t1
MSSRLTALKTALEELMRRGVCSLRYTRHMTPSGKAAERWDFKLRLLMTGLYIGLELLVLDADSVLLSDPFRAVWADSDLETGTDHFFPERDLWQPEMRPEENLNTGFLYADGRRKSSTLFCFLAQFLELFEATDRLALPRDFFDQRAFNKFVLMHLATEPATVLVHYGNSTVMLPSGWPPERLAIVEMLRQGKKVGGRCLGVAASRKLVLRVLDPAEICHGMNYFWRGVHLATDGVKLPVFVHANGVDEKIYFMRDRGIWFVDDWSERFPQSSRRFLQYTHPRGQDLKGDFGMVLAALQLAQLLSRILVLPRTMNCANSPASAAKMLHWPDCTVDQYASAKILFRYFNGTLAESSLAAHPRFLALATQRILESDVGKTLERLAGGQLPKLPCKFAYWPGRQMACRDESFLHKAGPAGVCQPGPGQEGCGVKGFACCEVFHGWADKLELFTGHSWALPCNCGLYGPCVAFERTEGYPQLTASHRCCHTRFEDPPMLQCIDVGSFPPSNPMTDFNSYSSDTLWAFASSLISPADVFEACQRWTEAASVSMGLSTQTQDVARDCTWTVSTFLLDRERHELLVLWLAHMLEVRRPLWSTQVTLSMASGAVDSTSFSLWKLHHDMQQLDFLISGSQTSTFPSRSSLNLSVEWLGMELLPLYAGLREQVVLEHPKQEVFVHFQKLHGIFNRALHVHYPWVGSGAMLMPAAATQMSAWKEEAALVVDESIHERVREEIYLSLLSSTIWYGVREGREAVLVSATLMDGLHHPALLALAREVRRLLPVLNEHPLRDIVARKYHPSKPNPGTEMHSWDGEVVACLWLQPGASDIGGELRILESEVPPDWSEEEAFDWGRPFSGPSGTVEVDITPRPRRLAIWPGRRLVRKLPTAEAFGPPARYEESWLEEGFLELPNEAPSKARSASRLGSKEVSSRAGSKAGTGGTSSRAGSKALATGTDKGTGIASRVASKAATLDPAVVSRAASKALGSPADTGLLATVGSEEGIASRAASKVSSSPADTGLLAAAVGGEVLEVPSSLPASRAASKVSGSPADTGLLSAAVGGEVPSGGDTLSSLPASRAASKAHRLHII